VLKLDACTYSQHYYLAKECQIETRKCWARTGVRKIWGVQSSSDDNLHRRWYDAMPSGK